MSLVDLFSAEDYGVLSKRAGDNVLCNVDGNIRSQYYDHDSPVQWDQQRGVNQHKMSWMISVHQIRLTKIPIKLSSAANYYAAAN